MAAALGVAADEGAAAALGVAADEGAAAELGRWASTRRRGRVAQG
jgi:hypothetical protein